MRTASKHVIAVLCSDIHLSHKPPLARAGEPDWYSAMKRPLDELWVVADYHSAPIVCAGDVYDKPDNPAQLVNWAIGGGLPKMFAIPGQHDLPYHRYEDIEKSSYTTLVKSGRIEDIPAEGYMNSDGLIVCGFPWGFEPKPTIPNPNAFLLAVVHRYIWTAGSKYPGAPASTHVAHQFSNLRGYHAAVYGDNHKGFSVSTNDDKLHIWNNGTLMRRRSDEADYRPRIGLLHADGQVTPHYLDCSKDVISDRVPEALETLVEKGSVDLGEFIEELSHLGDTELDFREAARRYMQKHAMPLPARRILLECMELSR